MKDSKGGSGKIIIKCMPGRINGKKCCVGVIINREKGMQDLVE